MAETLEKITDEEVLRIVHEQSRELFYELRSLDERVQASLRRMDEMDKKYKVGKYREN